MKIIGKVILATDAVALIVDISSEYLPIPIVLMFFIFSTIHPASTSSKSSIASLIDSLIDSITISFS